VVGAISVVGLAAVAAVLALVLGKPHVTVSTSDQALIQVSVSGMGTKLTSVEANSAGRPLSLVHDGSGLVPSSQLAQGETVQVTATAKAPSWLKWLVGSRVSSTKTVVTPVAGPASQVALASTAGEVPLTFGQPVSVVQYSTGSGPAQLLHLTRPSTQAEVTVPNHVAAGYLQVAAAPRTWETVAAQPITVTWFVAPPSNTPVAIANPAPGASTASANGPITLTFAKPIAEVLGSTRPALSPSVPGTWSQSGADTLTFTPSGFGFGPGTTVTVSFPKPLSVVGAGATITTAATSSSTYSFTTGAGSVLRMEQLLAQLNYLPLTFVPAAGVSEPTTLSAEVASMSQPLAGTFQWRWSSTPASLQSEWAQGQPNLILKGALMSFIAQNGNYDGYTLQPETVSQIATSSTWQLLVQAALANQKDPNPYSYVYVTQTVPETLTLWQNGSVILTSPCNTGIAAAPTADGTFPIYVRYTQNYMTGTNPDGSTYDDLVSWINYFNGGDAVHAFVRASYGTPQSLGCVELPTPTAQTVFGDLAIGDLVTVAN
jgi:lipoprotein-anchoring transpeptidase ErfK/SrfK